MKLGKFAYIMLLVVLMLLSIGLPSTLADSELVYYVGTTNYYQAIVTGLTNWDAANAAAMSHPLPNGCSSSHLATITSAGENQFIIDNFYDDLVAAFLGGFQTDSATNLDEGWQWVTGEYFYGFTYWGEDPKGNFEPNDWDQTYLVEDGEENYLNFTFKSDLAPTTRTAWNDTTFSNSPFNDYEEIGYIVEFECNQPPVVDAGIDQSAPRNTDINFEGSFTDAEGEADAPFSVVWDFGDGNSYSETVNAPGQLYTTHSYTDLGFYTVTLCVTDGPGAQGCDTATVEIYNRPPDCDAATPTISTIWSPNHEMVPVNINITDPDGDPVYLGVVAISHNEDENGLGDGNTSPDGGGIGTATALVRAERSGNGSGRTYTIEFFATDKLPNGDCDGSVSVFVPHDQSNNDNSNQGKAGNSANAPGHTGEAGNSANAPGHTGEAGNSANAPGHTGEAGNSANAPGHNK